MNNARVLTRFSPAEIRDLYKRAQLVMNTQQLRILRASRTLDVARILIVIPRTVGPAVVRNKLRRRIKNIFYKLNLFQGNFDYIIRLLPGAATMSFSELEHVFTSLKNIP